MLPKFLLPLQTQKFKKTIFKKKACYNVYSNSLTNKPVLWQPECFPLHCHPYSFAVILYRLKESCIRKRIKVKNKKKNHTILQKVFITINSYFM